MSRNSFDRELHEVKIYLFQVTGEARKNLSASVRYLENRDMQGDAMITESDEIINL